MKLPDFIVIGAMKAGTTSLFNWLGTHPEVSLPRTKEPNFFSDDSRWSRGVDEYARLFEECGTATLTAEASVAYTHPRKNSVAAARISAVVPSAKLVFLHAGLRLRG